MLDNVIAHHQLESAMYPGCVFTNPTKLEYTDAARLLSIHLADKEFACTC